jgi:hypothetical protein
MPNKKTHHQCAPLVFFLLLALLTSQLVTARERMMACQRRTITNTTVYFDFEYHIQVQYNPPKIRFILSVQREFTRLVDMFVSAVEGATLVSQKQHNFILSFDKKFDIKLGVIHGLTDRVNITGQIRQLPGTEVSHFSEILYLNDSDYSRQSCLDINNFTMQDIATYGPENYVIIGLLFFTYFLVVLFTALLSRGKYGRNRLNYAIITYISIGICFVAEILIFCLRLWYYRKYKLKIQYDADYRWANLACMLVELIGRNIAVTFWIYRNYRYLLIKKIHQILFRKNKDSKLRRFLLSKWTFNALFFTIVLTVQTIVTGLSFLVFWRFKEEQEREILEELPAVTTTHTAIIMSLTVLSSVVLCILQSKSLFKKGVYYFFFIGDPLLFRLENLTLVPFLPVPITISVIRTVFYNFRSDIYVYLDMVIMLVYLIFFGNGVTAFLQCMQYYKSGTYKPAVDYIELQRNFQNQQLIDLFRAYCIRNKLNGVYWIEMLKRMEQTKQIGFISCDEFRLLFHRYTHNNKKDFKAPEKISAFMEHVLKKYENGNAEEKDIQYSEVQYLHEYAFEQVCDSYSRFMDSNEMTNYQEMMQQLVDEFNIDDTDTDGDELTSEYHAMN